MTEKVKISDAALIAPTVRRIPKMSTRTSFQLETPLSKFIGKRCDELASRKSQKQIAHEAGFKALNFVSMMRAGDSKLPLVRVLGLARALEIDTAFLFRLAIAEFIGGQADAVKEIFGTIVSRNETKILKLIRELTNDCDPALNDDIKRKLTIAFA